MPSTDKETTADVVSSAIDKLATDPLEQIQDYPVQITPLPNKGRAFLAKRRIVAGELVLRSRPYMAVPDSENKHRVCVGCLAAPTSRAEPVDSGAPVEELSHHCADCQQVWYCSQECQDADQRIHALECAFLRSWLSSAEESARTLSPYAADYLWMLARCLARKHLEAKRQSVTVGGASALGESDGLQFVDVLRLCSNSDGFPADRQKEFRMGAKILADFQRQLPPLDNNGNALSEEDLFQLICKEECNSFGLYTYPNKNAERSSYALAVYPMAVYFNHSCAPNVVHRTEGVDECFYASRDIEAGEELLITYISLRQAKEERQKELLSLFLFLCDCRRCTNGDSQETLAMLQQRLCPRSGCNGSYLPHRSENQLSWICEACQSRRF